VFLRHGTVRGSLQPPYDGPFRVIERGDKTFVIDIYGKNSRVSIDRLKPAFILTDDKNLLQKGPPNEPFDERTAVLILPSDKTEETMRTRSGRRVRFHNRFQAGK
ncbi:hypothetical protein WN51_00012, partial [Melipona quadrifasciata]